jgi:dCMP deaminase
MDFNGYFISIADTVREKSKDPSSKIGAVIVGPDKQIVSTGFNGFPRGIDETDQLRWKRPIKYDYIEHAERNAIYNAARHGIALRGSTMYMVGFGPPCTPCIACAKAVIQSGIVRFVGHSLKPAPDNWIEELWFAKRLLEEAGVEVIEV